MSPSHGDAVGLWIVRIVHVRSGRGRVFRGLVSSLHGNTLALSAWQKIRGGAFWGATIEEKGNAF